MARWYCNVISIANQLKHPVRLKSTLHQWLIGNESHSYVNSARVLKTLSNKCFWYISVLAFNSNTHDFSNCKVGFFCAGNMKSRNGKNSMSHYTFWNPLLTNSKLNNILLFTGWQVYKYPNSYIWQNFDILLPRRMSFLTEKLAQRWAGYKKLTDMRSQHYEWSSYPLWTHSFNVNIFVIVVTEETKTFYNSHHRVHPYRLWMGDHLGLKDRAVAAWPQTHWWWLHGFLHQKVHLLIPFNWEHLDL